VLSRVLLILLKLGCKFTSVLEIWACEYQMIIIADIAFTIRSTGRVSSVSRSILISATG
jgi:hypothetical protein